MWNRRMTTSQASRVYGIPYNSLLMYVRGKYGKSLKLDKLKETTQAANDNLNIIGNSRSTPKEKLQSSPNQEIQQIQNNPKKNKHSSGSSSSSNKSQKLIENFENNPFMAAMNMMPLAESRVKDVVQQMQTRQALLDHSERLKELEKHMGPEQAKLLMPFFTSGNLGNSNQSDQMIITESQKNNVEKENVIEAGGDNVLNVEAKERQVQEILIEATKKNNKEEVAMEEDENKNNSTEVLKNNPLEAAIKTSSGAEISA